MDKRRYDGYIFDLDGTIYLGDRLIPGAGDTIARLRSRGAQVVFLSNKPLEPRSSYAAKLTRLGIPATSEDVINSTQALIVLLQEAEPGARLYVVGETKLIHELREAGFTVRMQPDDVDVVVASFDRTLDYTKLNMAHQALKKGARLYATNGDRTCPVQGGEIPDCAGVIAFLQATTGCTLVATAGKPSAHILQAALQRLGVPAERCLMVGDRLATDIQMGVTAGIDTALVLSGVTHASDLASSPVKPSFVLPSVASIP
ncbi:MAG: HAD-IIA family hydrolase [Anaerolineae bacterium]|jgi:arabinose operon protein AraL|nr:HAD-IIA family hydrolase [Chloroflexota bacterium]